jgi:hypothetical protein
LLNEKCTEKELKLLVHDMAYHQCSWVEISSVLGVSRQKIDAKYRDILNSAQSYFKHDLRRLQFDCSTGQKGNPTMLIWLGKQHLQQSETPQMEVKKDQFDKFIEWISQQPVPSSLPAQNKSIAS